MSPQRFTLHPIWIWLFAFVMIVVACSAPAPQAQPAVPPSVAASPTTSLVRSAQVAEVSGAVRYRPNTSGEWVDAATGQTLALGGQIQTLSDGSARLDVSPDSIIRVGPSTIFTLSNLAGTNSQPFTKFSLFTGELWVILNSALNGGSLDVETPVGVAAVRGSYLGVDYDDETDTMIGSCLEGDCNLRNGFGLIDLIAEQETSIVSADLPPLQPKTMDPVRLDKWQQLVKEAQPLLAPARARMQATWNAPSYEQTRSAFQTMVPRFTPERTRPANAATEQAAVLTRLAQATQKPRTLSPQQIEKITQVATLYPTLNPTRLTELQTRIATSVPTLNATQRARVLTVVATLTTPLPTLSTAQSSLLTAQATVTLNATQQAALTQLPILLTQRATLNPTQQALLTRIATEFSIRPTVATVNSTQAILLTRVAAELTARASQQQPTRTRTLTPRLELTRPLILPSATLRK